MTGSRRPTQSILDATFVRDVELVLRSLIDRPRDRSWFFPVLLEDVEIPLIPIGPGETLGDLQAISLAWDWDTGVRRLARAVRSAH